MTGGFVRAARASDAAGLARVQAASWSATLAELVPDEVLAELTSYAALATSASTGASRDISALARLAPENP